MSLIIFFFFFLFQVAVPVLLNHVPIKKFVVCKWNSASSKLIGILLKKISHQGEQLWYWHNPQQSTLVTAPPPEVPWHNHYEALQMEVSGYQDNASSSLEVTSRLSQSSCAHTASIKEERGVLVIGNTLLMGKRRSKMQTLPTL